MLKLTLLLGHQTSPFHPNCIELTPNMDKLVRHQAQSERISEFLLVIDLGFGRGKCRFKQGLPYPQTFLDFGKDCGKPEGIGKATPAMC